MNAPSPITSSFSSWCSDVGKPGYSFPPPKVRIHPNALYHVVSDVELNATFAEDGEGSIVWMASCARNDKG